MRGEDFCAVCGGAELQGSPPHARGRRGNSTTRTAATGITPACAGKTSRICLCGQPSTDHPRMRGEDSKEYERNEMIDGSPPHARGRPSAQSTPDREARITPACAGKTGLEDSDPPVVADHPRMRGEDACTPSAVAACAGSPPHARGRRPPRQSLWNAHRITPACAGKTSGVSGAQAIFRDHPRMRGEDALVTVSAAVLIRITPACAGKTRERQATKPACRDHPRMRGEDVRRRPIGVPYAGSPPHARGRLRAGEEHEIAGRITPACAGKTQFYGGAGGRAMDHPRMRGEDGGAFMGFASSAGSPPHARGRPWRRTRIRSLSRITPACAGKTRRRRRSWDGAKDHPRMRGEDHWIDGNAVGRAGSPPHARGRPLTGQRRDVQAGITPACAGKTQSCRDSPPSCADHPRMRGEDRTPTAKTRCGFGSPPHARGRLEGRGWTRGRSRITPACAGKTCPLRHFR